MTNKINNEEVNDIDICGEVYLAAINKIGEFDDAEVVGNHSVGSVISRKVNEDDEQETKFFHRELTLVIEIKCDKE